MQGTSFSGLKVTVLVTLLFVFLAAIAEAATVSGTVTNSNPGMAGRVYVALSDQYGNKNLGVSKAITARWRFCRLYHQRRPERHLYLWMSTLTPATATRIQAFAMPTTPMPNMVRR